jgi:hypothetical protein
MERLMIGASLSRWTMAFFAVAVWLLVAAEVLMSLGYGFPAHALEAPETLLVVHLVAIGWLSLLMCGALFQFVPVLVAKPLRRPALVLPVLVCITVGLSFLLAGFLKMAGTIESDLPFLAFGGTLLPLGFALAVWPLAETLWTARPLALPARFVAMGLVCLVAVAVLGSMFAHLLSGTLSGTALIERYRQAVPLHAAIGIGGWLTFSAIGVSYRLLPMFMLAPDHERATSRWVWRSGVAALLALCILAPVELAIGKSVTWSLAIAGSCGLVALVLYGADLVFFFRHRKRRAVELNIRAARGAFAALAAASVLGVVLVVDGTLATQIGALVYLVFLGWLGGLGLSQLYKIVPFLTWLECYGPVMGRKPTPRVQDLVAERRAGPWFALYFAGVFVATGALLADMPGLFRMAAAATLLSTVAIATELVLARTLHNVAAARRFPDGTRQPALFIAMPKGR